MQVLRDTQSKQLFFSLLDCSRHHYNVRVNETCPPMSTWRPINDQTEIMYMCIRAKSTHNKQTESNSVLKPLYMTIVTLVTLSSLT